MKYVFVNGRIAMVVRYWDKHLHDVEDRTRVEVRRVDPIDAADWRPGTTGGVGPVDDSEMRRAERSVNLDRHEVVSFQYHPEFFDGGVGRPSEEGVVGADVRAWIEQKLTHTAGLVESCEGIDPLGSFPTRYPGPSR